MQSCMITMIGSCWIPHSTFPKFADGPEVGAKCEYFHGVHKMYHKNRVDVYHICI